MNYHDTIVIAAFDAAMKALTAREQKEADEQHERLMQGWMNDLDQDDQAVQDFCRD